MSVAILVHELQNEPFNPILFYKPQGSESEKKPFLKKIFFLSCSTEIQMELYQKISYKILCIDASHSTNVYRFKLITCLVQDKFKQGTYRYNKDIDKLITTHGTVDPQQSKSH